MKKNIVLSLFTICLLLIMIEVSLRLMGFKVAYSEPEIAVESVQPDSVSHRDSFLGWRGGVGEFKFFNNDSVYFTCHLNAKGNRVTSQSEVSLGYKVMNNTAKKIYLYGCSFTFGYSVSDSSTYPYYLQSMLPDVNVCNKGVPAYSPVQMYLSLIKDVENGDKPNIAVINYASFQDERSVLGRRWLHTMRWIIGKFKLKYNISDTVQIYNIDYPYAKLINNDSISIEYLKWQDWSKDIPFSDKSVLVNLVNTTYNKLIYAINKKKYDRINLLCLYKILEYCKQNEIQVVYYGLTGDSNSVLDSLSTKGAITKLSSVDYKSKGYNCSPIDPGHPSAKAHRIYAQEVFDCLVLNKLINK